MNIDGITYLKIEEESYVSNTEPSERYFKCIATRNGVDGYGIGENPIQAIIDCLDWIESYNSKTEEIIEKLEDSFPF